MKIYDISVVSSGYLPIEDFDADWASQKQLWKRVMTRDVLSKIEKGEKPCGFDKGVICSNCYANDEVCFDHQCCVMASFRELKASKECPWVLVAMPNMDVFDYRKYDNSKFAVVMEHYFERLRMLSWNQEFDS